MPDVVRLFVVVVLVRGAGGRAVRDILRAAGARVRGGVYEVACTSGEMQRTERKLGSYLEEGDLVRVYPVCARCRERVRLFGGPALEESPAAFIF